MVQGSVVVRILVGEKLDAVPVVVAADPCTPAGEAALAHFDLARGVAHTRCGGVLGENCCSYMVGRVPAFDAAYCVAYY